MRLHVYTLCWNEKLMLPYFLRHYGQFAERIIVYDNGSDDGSQDLVRAHPQGELREFASDGQFDESTVTRLREEVWKESRGTADWVVVCDMDEFLIHPRMTEFLTDRRARGVTISQPQGFQMVSMAFPTTDGQIYDEVRRGVIDSYFSKLVLFDPDAVQEMNYKPGSHFSQPTGRVVFDPQPELMLFHCKYLGLDYVRARYQALAQRRSRAMRQGGFGFQYEWNSAELETEFNAWLASSRPIEEFPAWCEEARRSKDARSGRTTSALITGPAPQLHLDSWRAREASQPVASTSEWLQISATPNFVDWLAGEQVSLAFSTGRLGKLILVGRNQAGQISVSERSYPRCRGLWSNGQTLWMAAHYQLWRFENSLAAGELYDGCDHLYIPRIGHTTGDLDVHDVACDGRGRPLFASTKFNCVATVADRANFAPLWTPPFLAGLAPQDRCHLTGVAIADGGLRYVTLAATSDQPEGWRRQIQEGGCVLEVPDGRVVASGLSLPHSPRMYRDRLWVLNSGAGHFGSIDRARNEFVPLTFCPGFPRGLAFTGNYALVGVSQLLPGEPQSELRLAERIAASGQVAFCGLLVIDLQSGRIVHTLRLGGDLNEISDVAILPGVVRPRILGFKTDEIERLLTIGPRGTL